VLREKRAEYGKEIVVSLSRQLEREYGRDYAEKNRRRMVQFAEVFPDREIVVSLIRQLTWTHFIALIPLEKSPQREFYAEMCRVVDWSVSTLRKKITDYATPITSPQSQIANLNSQICDTSPRNTGCAVCAP
jgi:hypothetical protein